MDPDLQKKLDEINTNLVNIKKGHGIGRAFFNGIFGAFGYAVGLIIVILILGWILDKSGVLPQLRDQMKNFQIMMGKASAILGGNGDQNQEGQGSELKGNYQITLPDGQVVNVNR